MLGNGFSPAITAIAAAQRRVLPPLAPSPMTTALIAQRSIIRPVLPKLGASLLSSWVSPFTAFQQHVAEFSRMVAHRSAADRVANVMQDLAEMLTIPRQQGLAHIMGRFWLQALSAAHDVARRAIEEVTGQRARIDRLSPARRRGSNRYRKRRSTLVLGFAQQHYVIKELLIRAPGSGGPSASPNRSSGDSSWQSTILPSAPQAMELTTT